MDGPTAAALRRSLTAFLFPDGSPSEEIHGSLSDSGSFQNLLASNPQSSVVFALHPSYLCIRAFLCTDGAEWSRAPAQDEALETCVFSCDIELVRFLDHVYVGASHASAGLVTLRSSISMNPAPQNGIQRVSLSITRTPLWQCVVWMLQFCNPTTFHFIVCSTATAAASRT